MTCQPLRNKFVGSGRAIEGGALATRKQDFNAHASGGDFRHCADQINMNPVLPETPAALTVQETLEDLVALTRGMVVTIGNSTTPGDVTVGTVTTPTFADALNYAFANFPQLANGGTIFIKSGSYLLTSQVSIPINTHIVGEGNDTSIGINFTSDNSFYISPRTSTLSVGYPTSFQAINNYGLVKFSNLVFFNYKAYMLPSSTYIFEVPAGANFELSNCQFFGTFDLNTGLATNGIVTCINSSSLYSTVTIRDCVIDGVIGAINFQPNGTGLDRLIFNNNVVRYTSNVSGAVVSYCKDLDISNNKFYGFVGVGSCASPIVLYSGASSTTFVNINIQNNIGGFVNSSGALTAVSKSLLQIVGLSPNANLTYLNNNFGTNSIISSVSYT